jgi:Chaperone of endosialidase/YadA head domain repeat (2 copies)
VGIGVQKPEATLDVNGEIRARGGIRFDDGTLLTSAPTSVVNTLTGKPVVAASDTPTPNASGNGTANRLARWLDGTGTLGDSSIFEADGLTVFGRSTPLFADASTYHLVEMAAPGTKTPLTLVGGSGSMEFWKDTSQPGGFPGAAMSFGMAVPGTAATNDIIFSTYKPIPLGGFGWAERLRLTQDGNLGVGVAAPAAKLDVAGNIKMTGAGSKLIFADGTSMTTAATGGGSMTGSAIVNAINDPATAGLIGDNRISPNVARLNAQNAWTGQNTFVNGLSANGVAITNVGNPVSATDATNKAYVDGGFVKFVPGAEQLSVGDANGTAPMINLRGGSTCCSGPGGHTPAWFKVFQNGSFVATGNLGIGVSPMQGKGYRTSWDSYKGAFRSGYADAEWDDANVGFFSWAGGSNSTAIGLYALAFGDTNSAESTSSIVFGSGNQVKGAAGFSAGAGNRVCDTYGVALGNNAKSGGPYINGKCDPDSFNIHGLAAVAIGYNVTADQDHTTAMGKFASNNGFTGTFVWSDGSATQSADTFRNTANNEFALRATGGFRFRTNLAGTTGCNLPAGSGVFNCTSSRYTKENFSLTSGNDVLSRLRRIPITTWNYISEGRNVRHMGPMAEDFYQAFKLGTGNTSIGVQDLAGVSLSAIQELDQRTTELQQKTAEVDQLRQQVDQLRLANEALEKRLTALEQSAKSTPRSQRRK